MGRKKLRKQIELKGQELAKKVEELRKMKEDTEKKLTEQIELREQELAKKEEELRQKKLDIEKELQKKLELKTGAQLAPNWVKHSSPASSGFEAADMQLSSSTCVIISETWWTVQPWTMFPAHSLGPC